MKSMDKEIRVKIFNIYKKSLFEEEKIKNEQEEKYPDDIEFGKKIEFEIKPTGFSSHENLKPFSKKEENKDLTPIQALETLQEYFPGYYSIIKKQEENDILCQK